MFIGQKNMFLIQNKLYFTQICLAISLFSLGYACQSGKSQHVSKVVRKAPVFQEIREEMGSVDDGHLEEYRRIPLRDFFANYLKQASNDPVDINGHIIDNPKTIIEGHQGDIETLADEFPTIGDWMDGIGVDTPRAFEMSGFEQGADFANHLFNEGGYEAVKSSSESQQIQPLMLRRSSNKNLLCLGSGLTYLGGVGNVMVGNPWGWTGVASGVYGMDANCDQASGEPACPPSDIRCVPV